MEAAAPPPLDLTPVRFETPVGDLTSAVVVASGEAVPFEAQEHVEGKIAPEPRGASGFGYDPLFFFEPFGRTFGEVPQAEKDRVSHRGKAFARLREFLGSLQS